MVSIAQLLSKEAGVEELYNAICKASLHHLIHRCATDPPHSLKLFKGKYGMPPKQPRRQSVTRPSLTMKHYPLQASGTRAYPLACEKS